MALLAIDLDPELTETEHAAWETAHRFARDVMRPAGEALDRLPAGAVIAKDSVLWDVFRVYRELGLNTYNANSELSLHDQARLRCIVGEELGWGDSGLAISLGVSGFPTMMAQMSANPALIERFPAGTLGCWAITEPDHGSDLINFDGTLNHPGGRATRPNCLARRDGNQFVISGQKSAWVSNGTIAEAAALFCSVDMGDGRLGGGVFVVPLNEGGVKKGKPTDKIGQRALNQGEIFFDGLKVPADAMVVAPEAYRAAADRVLCLANGSMGTTFVGCARAALELAIGYSKDRIQGDVPIFMHQSMKSRLFKMYQKVEAARALNQRVVRINMTRETPLLEMAIASKVTSTQAAFDVSSEALQVFGGAGISRDCPIEKIFRDARISMIEDGCNEVLGMVAAARILDRTRKRDWSRQMKMNAYVAGVGMTRFTKMMDRGLKSIGGEAIEAALADAGLQKKDVQAAWMSNAAAEVLTGQECIRGQVVLRSIGMGSLPVINVENACASASTAFNQACAMVTAGLYDVVLACGIEKMYLEDKAKVFGAFMGAVDVEQLQTILESLQKSAAASGATAGAKGAGQKRSMFMDIYAAAARGHMARYGTQVEHFAMISAKNSYHGSLNPRAQFREAMTVEEVLAAPMIAEPLTRPMCSPIGDGAAAVVIVSERKKRELGLTKAVRVATSVLRSGWDHDPGSEGLSEVCAREAFNEAGLGPKDLSLVELHDASAPAELMGYESIGLCAKGEGGRLIADGATKLGGRIPVSTSGGLLRKGHPIGATGIAQIVEITEQLQGRSGARQVSGAKVGLCHNGGGNIGSDAAAQCVTILTSG